MGGGAWWAAVHGVAKSQTRLRDFTVTFHFHALEKEMATHSSVLAWRIPGMKVKVESEKVGLKLNIQKMKIIASGPITSWEIDGETVATVSDFILGGSKISADGDCSH